MDLPPLPLGRLVAIAHRYGLDLREMRLAVQRRAHIDARRAAYLVLVERGWTVARIARFFRRNHTTVLEVLDRAGGVRRSHGGDRRRRPEAA